MTTRDIYIDSTKRTTTLYPSGNSYTMYIQNPMKNVVKVDLISAVIPNTMYNITNSNIFSVKDLYSSAMSQVRIDPGFYSAYTLSAAINNNQSNVNCNLFDTEGRFILSNVAYYQSGFAITNVSSEFFSVASIGNQNATIGTSTLLPTYMNSWAVISSNVVNMGTVSNYIFLEIDELRPPFPIDAVQDPVNSESFLKFATIPMDVISGGSKVFKEMSDYKISVEYPTPIDKIDRLTIRWLDTDGNTLNFNGGDHNSILLRFYMLPPPPDEVTPETPKILERVFENKSILFYFVIAFILILIILFI